MALWVRPPPQGFSQARRSSKIVTWKPSRARRSPQSDPAGPPPTMAISLIRGSGQRQHRRDEPGKKYSTKQSGSRGGGVAAAQCIGAKTREKRKQGEEGGEQEDQELAG